MVSVDLDKLIRETVESFRPFPTYEITENVRKAVEKKLYGLPELCEKLEEAEGLDALLISWEIKAVKRALELIQDDPYYPLIPARYFDGADDRAAAFLCSCDKATIWRNRKRLLDRMAVNCLVRVHGGKKRGSGSPNPAGKKLAPGGTVGKQHGSDQLHIPSVHKRLWMPL